MATGVVSIARAAGGGWAPSPSAKSAYTPVVFASVCWRIDSGIRSKALPPVRWPFTYLSQIRAPRRAWPSRPSTQAAANASTSPAVALRVRYTARSSSTSRDTSSGLDTASSNATMLPPLCATTAAGAASSDSNSSAASPACSAQLCATGDDPRNPRREIRCQVEVPAQRRQQLRPGQTIAAGTVHHQYGGPDLSSRYSTRPCDSVATDSGSSRSTADMSDAPGRPAPSRTAGTTRPRPRRPGGSPLRRCR